MSKNIYIIIGSVIIIVLGGFLFFQSGDAPEQSSPEVSIPPLVGNGESITIRYTDSGYVPKEVTISQGTEVIFENENNFFMWPATAIHPTHTIYPGSSIRKCGGAEKVRIFDACQAIAQQGSWSFIFQDQGSWGYHDHLQARFTGKIIVE
jgi:plastocyanin